MRKRARGDDHPGHRTVARHHEARATDGRDHTNHHPRVIPFAASFSVINDPTSHTTVLLSLVLFFAPILMPTLIALSATSAGQVVLAAAGLTAATIVALAILGGRICGNSVLGVVRLAVEGGWTCWP